MAIFPLLYSRQVPGVHFLCFVKSLTQILTVGVDITKLKSFKLSASQVQDMQEKPPGTNNQLLTVKELTQMLEENASPSASFYALLALATTIATFGLLGNNTATIIGAMIVAPLMNPIVSLSYGIISVRQKLLKQSTFTLLTGIVCVIAIAFFLSELVDARVVGSEIVARTTPNLIDLGVAIASGSAGGLALSNRNISNAFPGVAIAVALVPPLCVVGIGLSLGSDAVVSFTLNSRLNQNLDVASGAFLLFLTNLAGIIISAGIVFVVEKYGKLRKSFLGLLIAFLTIILLSVPLNNRLQEFLLTNRIFKQITEFGAIYAREKDWVEYVDTKDIFVSREKDKIAVFVSVIAPQGVISSEDVKKLENFLTQKNQQSFVVQVQVFPFKVYRSQP